MQDSLFLDAVYYIFMNRFFVETLVGGLTFLCAIIALLTIIKKWGGSY